MSENSWFFIFGVVGAAGGLATVIEVGRKWFKQNRETGSRRRRKCFTVSKSTGVLCLGLLIVSLALNCFGFYRSATSGAPRMLEWGVANQHCNVVVDTSQIADMANKYDVVLACGIVDPTVDQLEDKRIILSSPFNIAAGAQAISLRANISETGLVLLINEQKGEEEEIRDEREFSWCCSFPWGFGCRGTERRLASWRAAAECSGSQSGRRSGAGFAAGSRSSCQTEEADLHS
jgi:hypothetical protein